MIVFVVGIFAYPIAMLFLYSVQNVGTSAFMPSSFAGLSNFRYIFSDALFATALLNNLKLFLCVPIMVVLSVIIVGLAVRPPARLEDLPHPALHPLCAVDPRGRRGLRLYLRVPRAC